MTNKLVLNNMLIRSVFEHYSFTTSIDAFKVWRGL